MDRITTSMLDNNLLAAIDQSQQTENTTLQQVETGQTVTLPSDNPAVAATYVRNQSQNASLSQYLQNVNIVSGSLQTATGALSSAVTALNQAVSLGTEGASSGLSAEQQQSLSVEVGDIQNQILNLSNTTYQGQYIFAGTNSSAPAFTADSNSSTGVSYQGSANVNHVEIAPGSTLQSGVAGSQLFTNPNGNVFQALNDLKTALANGDSSGTQTAVTEVSSALDQLNQQQEFYGNAVDTLQTTQTQLTGEQTSLGQEQTALIGTNMASAITGLSSDQEAYQAILDAGSLINNTNVLSLLTAPTN